MNMSAQEKARKNFYKHCNKLRLKNYDSCYAYDNAMSFANPNPNIGYGQLLIAIATLPKEQRKTHRSINDALSKPTPESYGTKSIFGCDSYLRLNRAKLIEKKNNVWQLTKLGKLYVKEMKLI